MNRIKSATRVLLPRQAATDTATEFLALLQDPFGSHLQSQSVWAALGSSVGISLGICLFFCVLRPHNNVVYAPKLKHADEKHAPPPLGKGLFAWMWPLWKTSEQELIGLVGMDGVIFLRFTRMCRDLFVTLAVVGCGVLIPTYITATIDTSQSDSWIVKITPSNVFGSAQWATVAVAWIFDAIICGFLWWTYRKVLQLRRQYFETEEYQHSLHARTLMLYDIPKQLATDEGIARIIDEVAPQSSFSRTAIARDVKILPELIREHEETVRQLEKVLAIYLKDPQNLPPARPTCYPSRKDRSYDTYPKGQKIDAIEYLTRRIRSLELEIKEVRQGVDRRSTMPYGFASYADISEAHAIAYASRRRKPRGTVITLAPRPNDIIWDNMPLSAGTRATRRLWNNLWIAILTLLWVAPNAMIAIFLVNIANIGKISPAFQTQLEVNTAFWSIVQGIASPAVTSIVYLTLPIIFRRMSIRAGDQTKTGRERHVIAKFFAFWIFNNLVVFSLFSACWVFISTVIRNTDNGTNAWQAILDAQFGPTVLRSLCSVSTYWITWLLQRQLGAAIDIAQLWTLFYSFVMRKFSSPTPRELIELTAPPSFDYAGYYTYYLVYCCAALAYAPLQPLVLAAVALYFSIDVWLKKYLLLYIFVTKTESGGSFWRVVFNRLIFGTILFNLVVFLIVWVQGVGDYTHAFAVVPLPFLVLGFKIYCSRTFDDKIHFYATRNLHRTTPEGALNVKQESQRNDRLAAKFGHPALYKPLITPMVHAKAQNILASVYQGRLTDGRDAGSGDSMSVSGYSDAYVLDTMASGKPGKLSTMPGFEVVPESRLDFEFYKNRDEFAAEHGAGELFGAPSDADRPGTPGTGISGPGSPSNSRPTTPTVGGMGFAGSRQPLSLATRESLEGTSYPYGYNSPAQQSTAYRGIADVPMRARSPMYGQGDNESATNLVRSAASMPMSPPVRAGTPGISASERGPMGPGVASGIGNPLAPGMLGGGPYGYGGLPQSEIDLVQPSPDPMQYDYFRGGRRKDTRNESGSRPGTPRNGGGGGWGRN